MLITVSLHSFTSIRLILYGKRRHKELYHLRYLIAARREQFSLQTVHTSLSSPFREVLVEDSLKVFKFSCRLDSLPAFMLVVCGFKTVTEKPLYLVFSHFSLAYSCELFFMESSITITIPPLGPSFSLFYYSYPFSYCLVPYSISFCTTPQRT